jgi:hypothetical protein
MNQEEQSAHTPVLDLSYWGICNQAHTEEIVNPER